MKFIVLIFAIIMAFTAEARDKVKSFTYSDQLMVKKVRMKPFLPTNFSKLYTDFYFEEKMIARK